MADANLTPLVGVFGGTDCMDKKKPYVLPRFAAYDPKNAKSGTDKLNPTPTILICDDNPQHPLSTEGVCREPNSLRNLRRGRTR
jgi:hypothetical protein